MHPFLIRSSTAKGELLCTRKRNYSLLLQTENSPIVIYFFLSKWPLLAREGVSDPGSQDSQCQATLYPQVHGHSGDEKTHWPRVGFFPSLWKEDAYTCQRERLWKFLDGATIYTKIVGIVIQNFMCAKIYKTVHTKNSILLSINLWKKFCKNIFKKERLWEANKMIQYELLVSG